MLKIQMIFNELRTVHTLSSDLPLMIFFSYLPSRRFPVFILVVKQFPNLKFSPNVLHFETFRVILFVFFPYTRVVHRKKIVANTSHCNEKRQCFGSPFVWN